ncbi:putative SET and MYND domain-containing protein 3-like protein, partial [Operophtera brumata]
VKLLKCSGCQFVHYCGRLCQKEAWGDHKWECANFKRVAPKVLPDGARMLSKIINRLARGDGHHVRAFYAANSSRSWKDLMSREYKVLPDGAWMLSKIINRLARGDGHHVRASTPPTRPGPGRI